MKPACALCSTGPDACNRRWRRERLRLCCFFGVRAPRMVFPGFGVAEGVQAVLGCAHPLSAQMGCARRSCRPTSGSQAKTWRERLRRLPACRCPPVLQQAAGSHGPQRGQRANGRVRDHLTDKATAP